MKFFLLFISLALTACGSQLRKSFCENEVETTFPKELQGVYEFTLAGDSPMWSGSSMPTSVTFQISDDSLAFTNSLPGVMTNQSKLCRLDKRYIIETQKENGTFELSEIIPTEQGFSFSMLVLDSESIEKPGLNLVYLPEARKAVINDEKEPFLDVSGLTMPFILDNRNLSQTQTLNLLKPLSFQMVYRKKQGFLTNPAFTIYLKSK